MNDLYKKIQLAVKYNMSADDVKVMINHKPVIDTITAKDKNALMMVDLSLKEHSEIKVEEIRKSIRAMYWIVVDEEKDVTITGLAWQQNKKVASFSGKVLTP